MRPAIMFILLTRDFVSKFSHRNALMSFIDSHLPITKINA